MIRKDKIKIVTLASLLIILVALIYLYFSSRDVSITSGNTNEKKIVITKEKFIKDIDSIIFTFGIKKEWIKEISSKETDGKNKSQLLWIARDISIPSDLPVIEINHEITNYLNSNNFDDKVSENPKTKDVVMNIFDKKDTPYRQVGYINFIYSDSVKRKAAAVCIVLDSIDSYSLSDVEKILSSAQIYSVILPLRNDKSDYQSRIIDVKKDYLLNFSIGGEKDIEADFRDDMKENLWRSKIKAAGINFPKASGIILSGRSSSEFEIEITDEFVRNNLIVYKDTMFTDLRSENKVESLLEDLSSKGSDGPKSLFYKINLSPQEFSAFDNKVYKLKKAGYRFYTFKELLKKNSKGSEK